MTKKAVIIGAGLAGLSAGIHLQQAGVETEIYELSDWAGGMFTSWVRKGYRFDGCIHWMVGTKPGASFHALYREIDLLKEDTQIYSAPKLPYDIDGTVYEVPMDFEKFRIFLLTLSPEDGAMINELCDDAEAMARDGVPFGYPSGPIDGIRFLLQNRTFIRLAGKYLDQTIEEYLNAYHSDILRRLFRLLLPSHYSAEVLVMMLAMRMSGNAGYPMGGSLAALRRIESKYRSLGGQIHFHTPVDEIVVKNGRATGIRCGEEFHPADSVIAACDAYDTLMRMLGGHFPHAQLNHMLENGSLFSPELLVSFGLKKQFGIPYTQHVDCADGIPTSPDTRVHGFLIRSFDFDPSAAPENGSSVMAMLEAPLAYWKNLRASDIKEYNKCKQQIAEDVADYLEKRYPGFKDAIEVMDIATPATYIRLANNYKASFEGFAPTPSSLKTRIRKTVPGVKNLILCGQWTTVGGGICASVASGKDAARLVLADKSNRRRERVRV